MDGTVFQRTLYLHIHIFGMNPGWTEIFRQKIVQLGVKISEERECDILGDENFRCRSQNPISGVQDEKR